MTIDPIQLPEQYRQYAIKLHALLRGEFGPWEVVFDGETLSIDCPGITELASFIAIKVGKPIADFLNAKTSLLIGEKKVQLERPAMGIIASNLLTYDGNASIPAMFVITRNFPDPIAHHLSADADGSFTLKLRTRFTGAQISVRILLEG